MRVATNNMNFNNNILYQTFRLKDKLLNEEIHKELNNLFGPKTRPFLRVTNQDLGTANAYTMTV